MTNTGVYRKMLLFLALWNTVMTSVLVLLSVLVLECTETFPDSLCASRQVWGPPLAPLSAHLVAHHTPSLKSEQVYLQLVPGSSPHSSLMLCPMCKDFLLSLLLHFQALWPLQQTLLLASHLSVAALLMKQYPFFPQKAFHREYQPLCPTVSFIHLHFCNKYLSTFYSVPANEWSTEGKDSSPSLAQLTLCP